MDFELKESIGFLDLADNHVFGIVDELAVAVLHLLDVAQPAVLGTLPNGEAAVEEVVQEKKRSSFRRSVLDVFTTE